MSSWRMGGNGWGTLSEGSWPGRLILGREFSFPPPGVPMGLRLTPLLPWSTCCWCRNIPGRGCGAAGGRGRQSSRVWCPRHLGEGKKETPGSIASTHGNCAGRSIGFSSSRLFFLLWLKLRLREVKTLSRGHTVPEWGFSHLTLEASWPPSFYTTAPCLGLSGHAGSPLGWS